MNTAAERFDAVRARAEKRRTQSEKYLRTTPRTTIEAIVWSVRERGVTERSVTPESQPVTTVTPVTYEARKSQQNNVTSSQSERSGESSVRYEERAAIIEHDGAVPRNWAEIMARLDPINPPVDVPIARWQQFIDDCGHFLGLGWANRAEALGWGPLELFGCDRERPLARYDHMGLLWMLQGRKLVALTGETATIDTLTGSLQSYPRRSIDLNRVMLPWELASLRDAMSSPTTST